MNTISKYDYLEAAQVFHWATAEHFILWFTGKRDRHKRTEVMLPRLVGKNKLIVRNYGKKYIYTVPRRKFDNHYEHGLGCTEGLVRYWRSRMDGVIIPERRFRGAGVFPEWGIKFPSNTLLMYEFCTADNFYRAGMVKSKITRYKKQMGYFEKKFGGMGIVVFVCDAPRRKVDELVQKILPAGERFFFTDYYTFLDAPIGEQLSAPIYIWGEDGWPYALEGQDGELDTY